MATWLQRYEDNGRLIDRYVDESGQEFFQDAGPAAPNDGYGPTQQVSEADYLQAHQGFNPYASTATAAGIPSATWTPPRSNPFIPTPDYINAPLGPNGVQPPAGPPAPTVGPGGNVQTGGTTARAGAPADAAEAEYWQNRAKMEQADQASNLVYRDWMMRTGNDKLAFEKATQAWNQKMAESRFDFEKEQAVLGQQRHQDQTALQYLGMNAQLHGQPRNYLTYLRQLNSTPQGIRDLVGAAAGRYGLARFSGGAPGVQAGRATVGSLLGDAMGGQQELPDGSGLPLPNQINLQNWSRMNPTQRDMLIGTYEDQGWRADDVIDLVNKSAPRFSGPRSARLVLQ